MPRTPPAWRQFEDRVEQQCRRYLRDGRAKIHKVDPPTRVIGHNPARIIFLENPFLDFIGIASTGALIADEFRPIMFEVKRTERPYLPLKGKGRGLTQKQLKALVAWRAAGAITGILWEHDAVVRWISGEALADLTVLHAGKLLFPPSLKLSDGLEVPQTPNPDFLDIAIQG